VSAPSSVDRFVRTADIRAAILGRETDVLDALGIRWREGGPHIRCPYRDHEDEHPSWRWDQPKARAGTGLHQYRHSIKPSPSSRATGVGARQ
jgi:hypothetical protein